MDTWWKSYVGRKQVLMEYMGLAYYGLKLRMSSALQ